MWQNWLRSRAFSIGTDKDAEFDQQTSLAPCWRKEVCHRKLMYMKLVSCVGRERCNVLSSKSRRWLGQEASIGQDASIRMQPKWDERSEVGWKMEEVKRHWHCITWLIALNDRQLCSVNCEQSAIGAASWVKEWQVESPVAFFNPLLLLLSCSVHDVNISNVNIVRLFRDALIFSIWASRVWFLLVVILSFDLDASASRTGSLSFCSCLSEHTDVFHLTRRSATVSFWRTILLS